MRRADEGICCLERRDPWVEVASHDQSAHHLHKTFLEDVNHEQD